LPAAALLQPAYDQGKGYLHTVYDKVTGKAQDASQAAQEQAQQTYGRAAGTAQGGQEQAGQSRGAAASQALAIAGFFVFICISKTQSHL
jgi:hypothetical protein